MHIDTIDTIFTPNASSPLPAVAASAPQPTDFIGHLLELGLPEVAAREARRQAERDPWGALEPPILLAIARVYARDQYHQKAIPWYEEAVTRLPPSEARTEARLELAWSYLMTDQPMRARGELGRLEAFSPDGAIKQTAATLRCLTHVIALEPAEARRCWQVSGSWEVWPEQTRAELEASLEALGRRRRWVPYAAAGLSAVFPGAGQALAGDARDGAAALVLNTAWILATIAVFREGLVVEATLFGLGFGYRYYPTNVRSAYERSLEQQARRQNAAMLGIVDVVLGAGGLWVKGAR